jgi:Icc protein
MTKIIVFTDLHMLAEGGRIIGLDPYDRLLKGIRHVNLCHPDAARVMLTGDLADDGSEAAYRRLRELLCEFEVPYSLMVGNHDYRPAFSRVFPEAPADAHGFIQTAIDIDSRYRLVLLDTLNGPPRRGVEHHAGYLCARRLDWLDRQLGSSGRRRVVLFMHHPPHDTGFPGMDAIRLANAAALYRLLARHGNVRHIFSGHVHRMIAGSAHGIPFSIFKSPVHQQPMDLASSETSLSIDEPAAYGIVLLRRDGILVHTEDYGLSTAPPRLPTSSVQTVERFSPCSVCEPIIVQRSTGRHQLGPAAGCDGLLLGQIRRARRRS